MSHREIFVKSLMPLEIYRKRKFCSKALKNSVQKRKFKYHHLGALSCNQRVILRNVSNNFYYIKKTTEKSRKVMGYRIWT